MSPLRAFLHMLAAGLVACSALLMVMRPFVPLVAVQAVAGLGFAILLGLLVQGFLDRAGREEGAVGVPEPQQD